MCLPSFFFIVPTGAFDITLTLDGQLEGTVEMQKQRASLEQVDVLGNR